MKNQKRLLFTLGFLLLSVSSCGTYRLFCFQDSCQLEAYHFEKILVPWENIVKESVWLDGSEISPLPETTPEPFVAEEKIVEKREEKVSEKIFHEDAGVVDTKEETTPDVFRETNEVIVEKIPEIVQPTITKNFNFLWGKHPGDGSVEYSDLILESNQSIFVTGRAVGSIDFAGTQLYLDKEQCFVAKYKTTGSFEWARFFSGTGTSYCSAITLSPNKRITIAGIYKGSIQYPSSTQALPASNFSSAFLLQMDGSGKFIQQTELGGSATLKKIILATLSDSSFVISGSYELNGLNIGARILNNVGKEDVFLAFFDKDLNFVSAQTLQSPNNETVNAITVDSSNQIYLVGDFETEIIVDGKSYVTQAPKKDVFVAKFSKTALLWFKSLNVSREVESYSVTMDNNNQPYLTGSFKGTLKDGNVVAVGHNSIWSGFILKMNPNGSWSWIHSVKATDYCIFKTLLFDKNNLLYVIGQFAGKITLDNGILLSSSNTTASFLLKFDLQKKAVGAASMLGGDFLGVDKLAADSPYLYAVGRYIREANFGSIKLSSKSVIHSFIVKIEQTN